jgi:hypothetical protein
MIKDCGRCKNANYSGGQQQLAERRKQPVETLQYVFCRLEGIRDHVSKNRAIECESFAEKEVVASDGTPPAPLSRRD